jgi:hypothetical protein
MTGRMYSAPFEDVAMTVAQDLWQIEQDASQIILHYFEIGQTSDPGDAAAELLIIKMRRVTDAVGAIDTPNPLDTGDAAATANVETNDTVQLVTGVNTIWASSWNIALPFIWMPPPEQRVAIVAGDALTITCSVPLDSLTIHGTLVFEEIGT